MRRLGSPLATIVAQGITMTTMTMTLRSAVLVFCVRYFGSGCSLVVQRGERNERHGFCVAELVPAPRDLLEIVVHVRLRLCRCHSLLDVAPPGAGGQMFLERKKKRTTGMATDAYKSKQYYIFLLK